MIFIIISADCIQIISLAQLNDRKKMLGLILINTSLKMVIFDYLTYYQSPNLINA